MYIRTFSAIYTAVTRTIPARYILRYILMDTLLTNDLLSNVHLNPTSTEMLNWAPPHAPSHTAPRHALKPCSFSVQMHVHGCVYCIARELLSVYNCSRIGNSLHDCKTFQPHAYVGHLHQLHIKLNNTLLLYTDFAMYVVRCSKRSRTHSAAQQ